MKLQKSRIFNKLYSLAKAGEFYRVHYASDGSMLTDYNAADKIQPKTILVNELTAEFETPENFRRFARRERSNWVWELYLAFSVEAALEKFEKQLIEKAIILPHDPDEELPQVTLNLLSVEYTHPVKREPAGGTQVSFTFQATVGRA